MITCPRCGGRGDVLTPGWYWARKPRALDGGIMCALSEAGASCGVARPWRINRVADAVPADGVVGIVPAR